MWIDGSSISHIVDAAPEEGLDWRSEVESYHTRCDCTHTRGLHSRRCAAFGRLRGSISAIIVGSDSSASTGAGSHLISLYVPTKYAVGGGATGRVQVLDGWRGSGEVGGESWENTVVKAVRVRVIY